MSRLVGYVYTYFHMYIINFHDYNKCILLINIFLKDRKYCGKKGSLRDYYGWVVSQGFSVYYTLESHLM